MTINKRDLFKGATGMGLAFGGRALAQVNSASADAKFDQITPGPFKPTWPSLAAGYKVPDWFRDAKFGIWAHWTAQCVPEQGDWYARNMYIEGHRQYKHHLQTYGHPADTGFMEINNLWKAENWDPDDLMTLYVRAGAKYFACGAGHHDNFDIFDSKFHSWNAVKVGPKKDIVGIWAQTARKHGLKFGVTNHTSHAWHWYQTAYGYDAEGPRTGQRYDAYRLTKADGKGKWWDGLDPQELYVGPTYVLPDGMKTAKDSNDWHEAHDRLWDENPPEAHPEFTRQWFLRCKDLIDSYKPDLLYFDNNHLPLGQTGLDIAAHYYNAALGWHNGRQEVVLNTKDLEPELQSAVVLDIERGFLTDISPHPWQTDTCLGAWHYYRKLYDEKAYKTAPSVIHYLCDIVSKNGNLLLNVPQRGDGTIDSEERAIVETIADWMGRFGDSIHGTRPWRVYGEGPTVVVNSSFAESKQKPFTADDIRFTTKDGTLFAQTLGCPEAGVVKISSLGSHSPYFTGRIERIEILGSSEPLTFIQDEKGLTINFPTSLNHSIGVVFKINGPGLV